MKHLIKIHYSTSDGIMFDTEAEAVEHEQTMFYMDVANELDVSLATSQIIHENDLVDSPELDEVGYWSITAPRNAEEASWHRNSIKLGIVHGSYVRAIDYAMQSEAFREFPALRNIKKIDIPHI